MILCNFCQRKETCNRYFSLPFTCEECEKNKSNYVNSDNAVNSYVNEIIYVDGKGNKCTDNDNTILKQRIVM